MKYLKINNKNTLSVLVAVAVMVFTSCLKKSGLNTDPETGTGTNNVVEFQNIERQVSYTSVYPQYDNALTVTGDTSGFFVNIDYAGSEATAPQDITVTLAVDTAALTTFNTSSSTSYVTPDISIYSFAKTAVIAKGTNQVQIRATIKLSASYNYSSSYALPLKITSTSYGTVSGNYNIAIFSFIAKNKYDGLYTITATAPMVDVTSSTLTGLYPMKSMSLITTAANSVALYDGQYYAKGYYHPILSGGTSTSAYGSFSPLFTFDATGKITSVGNYYGSNAGSNLRSGQIISTGVNQVVFNTDSSIQSFQVSYIMTQSVTSSNLPRTYFYEKYTYTGAR